MPVAVEVESATADVAVRETQPSNRAVSAGELATQPIATQPLADDVFTIADVGEAMTHRVQGDEQGDEQGRVRVIETDEYDQLVESEVSAELQAMQSAKTAEEAGPRSGGLRV